MQVLGFTNPNEAEFPSNLRSMLLSFELQSQLLINCG